MQELEKILEKIEEYRNHVCEDYSRGIEFVAGAKRVFNGIDHIIRKHMNDDWVSVEERLPAEGEEVLITTNVGLIATGYIHCCEWITGEEPDYPIAWKPLPEPYRPERSEGE